MKSCEDLVGVMLGSSAWFQPVSDNTAILTRLLAGNFHIFKTEINFWLFHAQKFVAFPPDERPTICFLEYGIFSNTQCSF